MKPSDFPAKGAEPLAHEPESAERERFGESLPLAQLGSVNAVAGPPGPLQALLVPAGSLDGPSWDRVKAYAAREKRLRRLVLVSEGSGEAASVAQGPMPLDEEACALLMAYEGFENALRGTLASREASPLLASLWPEARLVPVSAGLGSAEQVRQLGRTLRNVLDEDSLIVALPASPREGPLRALLCEALGCEREGILYPGRFPAVPALAEADKLTLSELVEDAVAAAACRRDPRANLMVSPRLEQRGGAFVTLEQRGRLRGCMGRLEAPKLWQAVAEAASMAARMDPRFDPLSADDLGELEIEISVLSRFRPIESIDEFEPGRHGLLLTAGYHRGLLLPQVATRYGFDREGFLEALAQKAGLPPEGWREAELQKFGVEAFSPSAR